MAVQPIDLQTLFSKLHQVSEDQAAQRDQAAQAQALVGQEIQKKGTEQANTVTLPEELQDGPSDITDKEEEGGASGSNARKRKRGAPNDTPAVEVFRDPDLGQNVDISG